MDEHDPKGLCCVKRNGSLIKGHKLKISNEQTKKACKQKKMLISDKLCFIVNALTVSEREQNRGKARFDDYCRDALNMRRM